MYRMLKSLSFAFLLVVFLTPRCIAQTINAASCSSTDVQNAINTATEGQTVAIPACPSGVSWTSGVTISGKGIHLQGAGSGRVVAYSVTKLPLTTGNPVNLTIAPTNVAGKMPALTNGQNLLIAELAFYGMYSGSTGTTSGNYLKGTVNSFDSSTGALSMNITSAGGTCATTEQGAISNCARWIISTSPSVNETLLINNIGGNGQSGMINVTVDGTVNTSVSGIHIAEGASPGEDITLTTNNGLGPVGGKSVLIHDNMLESGQLELIDAHTTQAVIWNNTFINNNYQSSNACIRIQDTAGNIGNWAWTTQSDWGVLDTTGQDNLYFETNDVEGEPTATDFDSGARAVFRDNFMFESAIGSHGADTSGHGIRYIEVYSNIFLHELYTGCGGTHPDPIPNCSGANLSEIGPGNGWMNIRGGTFVFYNNALGTLSGGELGSKPDMTLQMQQLNRHGPAVSCWGLGTTGGANYPAPRQVGMGRVTGTGSAHGVNYNCVSAGNPIGCSGSQMFGPASTDTATYVGDSEPAYIWGNNGGNSPLVISINGTDSGTSGTCTNPPNPDSPSNYIVSGRDYFNGTPKQNYTAYTYPHPLTTGTQSAGSPAAPTNLSVVVN